MLCDATNFGIDPISNKLLLFFLRGVGWNLNVPVFKGLYVNLFLNVL